VATNRKQYHESRNLRNGISRSEFATKLVELGHEVILGKRNIANTLARKKCLSKNQKSQWIHSISSEFTIFVLDKKLKFYF
jgi:hypothetical protein